MVRSNVPLMPFDNTSSALYSRTLFQVSACRGSAQEACRRMIFVSSKSNPTGSYGAGLCGQSLRMQERRTESATIDRLKCIMKPTEIF
jgi:hypothetical protein